MKKIIYILLVSFFWACSPEDITSPYPCLDGDCETFFEIDHLVSPGVYQDNNGYWHITHNDIQYFTIKGNTSELHPDYIVNGVPLIETIFDSDYWVWIDGLTFTVPLYSVLGFFTSGDYTNPIPVGNLTYTIEDMAINFPPLNIVGYSINPDTCLECPYFETLIGTRSKYNTHPKQQIFFDNQMVGDTAKVFVKTIFNSNIEIEKQFNIIFE
jgi:hypothetical protein|tara:strand:+ start:345 stop:980 length:636 start_codon:yes stop_codon:yes gene_type:complete